MAVTIQSKVTTTKIIFRIDDGKTGVITLMDGKYDRIVMPHLTPREHSKEWFALMKEIGDLILESEQRHGK